jgi:hypothetical protein
MCLLFCHGLPASSLLLQRGSADIDGRPEGLRYVIGTRRDIMAVERREIHWLKNLEEALEEARIQKRHVLLDFTAAPM